MSIKDEIKNINLTLTSYISTKNNLQLKCKVYLWKYCESFRYDIYDVKVLNYGNWKNTSLEKLSEQIDTEEFGFQKSKFVDMMHQEILDYAND